MAVTAGSFPSTALVQSNRNAGDNERKEQKQVSASHPKPAGPDSKVAASEPRPSDVSTEVAAVKEILRQEMCDAYPLDPPLAVDIGAGLDWREACLSFHEADNAVRTASAAQVREPLYRRSSGRWRHYERHLGGLLEALSAL